MNAPSILLRLAAIVPCALAAPAAALETRCVDTATEFRNALLGKVIGVVFGEAMSRIVRAFEDRARALYGT